MQQNITASLYYELCNVEKCILSTILTEEVAQWLNSYLTEKKKQHLSSAEITSSSWTYCCNIVKILGGRRKKYYASCVYRHWICRILIRITVLSRISEGMLILNICLCSNLMCHSITVTYIIIVAFLSTFLLCWFWLLLEDWEERGDGVTLHILRFFRKAKF